MTSVAHFFRHSLIRFDPQAHPHELADRLFSVRSGGASSLSIGRARSEFIPGWGKIVAAHYVSPAFIFARLA